MTTYFKNYETDEAWHHREVYNGTRIAGQIMDGSENISPLVRPPLC